MGPVVSVVAASPWATDGVRDHASLLSGELERAGVATSTVVVDWRGLGVRQAVRSLRQLRAERPAGILLHMSHLSWSTRGLPFGFLGVVLLCRRAGPTTIWVHDPDRIQGDKVRHRLGTLLKGLALRAATALSHQVIVAVEPDRIFWMTARARRKVTFCPSPSNIGRRRRNPPPDLFTVAMFGNQIGTWDAQTIEGIAADLAAQIGRYRLRLLGGGPTNAELIERLESLAVSVERESGDADRIADALACSHMFVAYRYGLSARSGSVAAAVSCELPVVGFAGTETGPVMEKLGVAFAANSSHEAIAAAAAALAGDPARQERLARINAAAADGLFSWESVGTEVRHVLGLGGIHDRGPNHA